MSDEKVDVIPEHIYVSVMPEGNLHLLILDSGSCSFLVQESDSTTSRIVDTGIDCPSMVEENDSAMVTIDDIGVGCSFLVQKRDSASAKIEDIGIEGGHGHLRRNSTGSLDVPFTRFKILSRYLASSIGSCHDYCKYGIRQASETKPWNPLHKRTMEMEEWKKINAVSIAEGKKKPSVSFKPSAPHYKNKKMDDIATTKTEVLPATNERINQPKRLSLAPIPNARGTSSYRGSNEKLKSETLKPSSVFVKGRTSNKYSDEIQANKDHGSCITIPQIKLGSIREKGKISSPSPTIHTAKKVVRQSNLSTHKKPSKGLSPIRSENVKSLKVGADKSSFEEVPEKILHVVESKSEAKVPTRMKKWDGSPCSSPSHRDKSLENGKSKKGTSQLVSSSAKLLSHTRKGTVTSQLSASSPIKSLRSAKNGPRVGRSSLASSSSSATPKSISHGNSIECDETGFMNKGADTCRDPRTRKGKGGTTNTKARISPVRKLKFREGKTVEIEPEIQNPKRLKFRRRVPGDSQNVKAESRKSNLKGTKGEAIELHVSENEPGKVVLRHQDVEGKKVVQSLLNNVIEETASKLVQTKKGKVKALVGAFETVICLQDSRPVPAAHEL